MPTLIRGFRLPTYKVSLQGLSLNDPPPNLEMQSQMGSKEITLKLGDKEIKLDSKRLLRAVHLLTND